MALPMHRSAQGPIVLINPPWITKDETVWHGIKGAMPPLSLLSIGAVLEQAGFEVQVIDAHLYAMSEQQVLQAIANAKPSIVGITMMTSTAIAAHQTARLAKQVDSRIKVVVGGVHPDSLPEETLRNRDIDYVVRGDGEYAMLELAQGLPDEDIAGLCYRRNQRPVLNTARPVLMDLNQLPPYAYHLVPIRKYYPAAGAYQKLPAINMLMTRGCPGKCIFCNSAETALRTRDAERVVDEIIHLRDTYGVREIQFYDDTFTVMKKNTLRFARLMKEKKVGVGFSCFARTDCWSVEMATALKEAGCHQVMFGVESGSSRMLEVLRKDIDLEKTCRAVEIAKEAGLEVRSAFIFGTPGETEQTCQETIDYALKLDSDLAIFNITTPYPGTQLYNWALQNGRLLTQDWWEYELGGTIVELGSISNEKLHQVYDRAFKVYYNRPSIYWRRLKKIRSIRHLKDSVDAFLQIMLKAKLSSRGNYQKDWLKHTREDYFDFEFDLAPQPVRLPVVLQDRSLLV
ncbi:MAG: anaerobic magnesium-protoporphyrin IX monomethyl ester cyclase [Gammaproteobacteria bacterium]|jgi:anaerobic magnesium-protoporphyrin IX monomethyl ester cyclase